MALPDMESNKTHFTKRPTEQEATIAALFFELLGSGEFQDIYPLISGYKGRYDLYAKWENRNTVIEFKYQLFGLFKDFNDEKKMFDEIDAVIIWEITERDRPEANRRGINVEAVRESAIGGRKTFPGSSHELIIESAKPLFVIELKELLELD